jgi:hypothetical protein
VPLISLAGEISGATRPPGRTDTGGHCLELAHAGRVAQSKPRDPGNASYNSTFVNLFPSAFHQAVKHAQLVNGRPLTTQTNTPNARTARTSVGTPPS